MKYQCSRCKEVFHYPMKYTLDQSSVEDNKGETKSRETYHCPFCENQRFTEFIEPEPDIISVKSVDLNEVDTYLKDGYVVEAMFAKTATIKKLAIKPSVNPDPDANEAFQDTEATNYFRQAEANYKKLEGQTP